ncbi:alpha-hydroxy acid oxidase [Emticicia sp. BO119]|uniref:alpha-hydroxy acid oxidase n=1 Tax=Emticicia sp. BO119 TaxID=2757768 RepID=UPI0015F12479|nr:alpha-hydroxy acid oxidase [Emticicia sp. BO119]MBA4849314.1 alpha-hydroxy-acid oxidizing protein [Emticicia sp. BO119]
MALSNNSPADLSQLINLFDFEQMAATKMTRMAYEYVASGAADEVTLRWNREAFDHIKLNTTVLNNLNYPDTKLSLFGQELEHPILIAPTAFHKIMHPDAEIATAKGAGAASTVYVVSSFTTTPLEEIVKVATQPLWFQLYVRDDRIYTKDLIQKAESLGYQALCVTVDTPTPGIRDRQAKVGFALPDDVIAHYSLGEIGAPKNPITWKDIEWLQSFTKIPVLLKGILNPEDAIKAVQTGVDGIVVSNHGARNLDTVPSTIEVLPRVAEKIDNKIPILLDGGIRRGTDVIKAIALGAKAVLIGKPICYGLACGGAQGVAKVIQILKDELLLAMILTGRNSLLKIDQSVIWH